MNLTELVQLAHPAVILAAGLWAETRLLPVLRKIVARTEETHADVKQLLVHQGLTPMSDQEGDEIAATATAPPAALAEGAKILFSALKNQTTPKTGA